MLISSEYRQINRDLHESSRTYGTSGHRWAGTVALLSNLVQSTDVLDYGCGKSTLAKSLGFAIKEYDPAIPGKEDIPSPADIVVCTDVLEHIEPEHLQEVLIHIAAITRKCAILSACTRPAKKNLPDGRNAHLNVQTAAWWNTCIGNLFEQIRLCSKDDEYVVLARPRRHK